MGSFIEKNVGNIEPASVKKRKNVKKAKEPKGCKDIWNFFQKRRRNNEDDDDTDVTLVTICLDWDFLLNLYTFYLHLYTFFIYLKHFYNFIIHICIVFVAWKMKGGKKQRRKKIFRKISRGFIFANLPFPKFSRGFVFANRRLSNISRGFNIENLSKIRENREHLSTRKLVPSRLSICLFILSFLKTRKRFLQVIFKSNK